jgi:hypothetical protein
MYFYGKVSIRRQSIGIYSFGRLVKFNFFFVRTREPIANKIKFEIILYKIKTFAAKDRQSINIFTLFNSRL